MNIYRTNKLLKDLKYYIQFRCIYHNSRLDDFPLSFKPSEITNNYDIWEKNNFFNPSTNSKETFSMILPPPNVTGTMHLGHALTATIQDTLARWYRMKGTPVIWVPGFDHAGIATQAVIEKYLVKTKNVTRNEMSKDEFMSFLWKWKNEKSSHIKNQLKSLGTTLDWSKEYFTLSETHNKAVIEAFLKLNNKGLLYRDKRFINWSPTLNSTISDIEVEYLEIKEKKNIEIPGYKRKITFGQIYEIAYDIHNSDEKIIVATTRPETICGDVAIAVNPNDDRYSKFVGQFVKNPLTNKLMPILSDENVKIDFGTGAVKITPAHDHFDYAVATKHNLEFKDIIDDNGNMNTNAGNYAGLPRYFARHKILQELSQMGLLKNTKDHPMLLPLCSRTGDVIEFLLKEQWYIKCKTMADKAVEAVRSGSLKLNPDIHEKLWFNWLENTRDWCVSRQIWWGHQIPAYKCTFNSGSTEWIVGRNEDEVRQICISKFHDNAKIEQDTDVLDTWFSSALLPFTAMGWPNKTVELENFYPLSLMETGHDIIFFWIARMVMLGLELTEKLPFKEVLLHGVLCDGRGKKMSKSSGNVILPENVINGMSPEDMKMQAVKSFEDGILSESNLKQTLAINSKVYPKGIPECGVDALRFALMSRDIRGRTVTFNENECEVNKFFGNKIWQASRYVIFKTNMKSIMEPKQLNLIDKWILSRLSYMISTVNENLEARLFYKATKAIKEFLYYEFCDFYVEGTKPGFESEQLNITEAHTYTLVHCLEVSLRMLSPFMPYIVDDLYSRLSDKFSLFNKYDSVAQASYPLHEEFEKYRNTELEHRMENVLNVIISIRKLLGNWNKKFKSEVHIVSNTLKDKEFIIENLNMITAVSKVNNLKIFHSNEYIKNEHCIWDTVGPFCNVYATLEDTEMLKQIKEKIQNKRSTMENKLQDLIKKKSHLDFSSKTEDEKQKVQERIESFEKELKQLPES